MTENSSLELIRQEKEVMMYNTEETKIDRQVGRQTDRQGEDW